MHALMEHTKAAGSSHYFSQDAPPSFSNLEVCFSARIKAFCNLLKPIECSVP